MYLWKITIFIGIFIGKSHINGYTWAMFSSQSIVVSWSSPGAAGRGSDRIFVITVASTYECPYVDNSSSASLLKECWSVGTMGLAHGGTRLEAWDSASYRGIQSVI